MYQLLFYTLSNENTLKKIIQSLKTIVIVLFIYYTSSRWEPAEQYCDVTEVHKLKVKGQMSSSNQARTEFQLQG